MGRPGVQGTSPASCRRAGRPGGEGQAVAKRLGLPIGPPSTVLRAFCWFRDMFLEYFWLGLSCSNTS
eukprot:4898652-Pyramimonas_sp.AAC.1